MRAVTSPSLGEFARKALGFTRATLDPTARAAFPRIGDYLVPHSCLGYIGWVGHGNSGDEWIFTALQRLLRPHRLLAVEGGVPPQMRAYSAIQLSRGHPFKARLIGGGTLFPRTPYLEQITRPEFASLPLYAFGFAALDADFWSSRLQEDFSGPNLVRWVDSLREARFLGVRDAASAHALKDLGLPHASVVGEPALALGDGRWLKSRRSGRGGPLKIGVNLGSHDPIWGRQERVRDVLSSVVSKCNSNGARTTFIPLSRLDLAEGRNLVRSLPAGALTLRENPITPDAALEAILDQDLIISQRLHACIVACAFGIPTISLAYNPKCLSFMGSMGLAEFAIRTDEVDTATLQARIDGLSSCLDPVSAAIWEQAESSRKTLIAASQSLLADLGMLGRS